MEQNDVEQNDVETAPAAGESQDPVVVVGSDGLARCCWAAGDPLLREYHDTEWGMPVVGEAALYERLCLEAFQSGLSWRTILAKRPAFRKAFADFDPEVVAAFTEQDVRRLMADAGIVRNQAKIRAAIANAAAVVALRGTGGLEAFIGGYRPEPGPAPRTGVDLPGRSQASAAMAKGLRSRGFKFVGPTTAHALMEAVGMVDSHFAGCHRRGCAG